MPARLARPPMRPLAALVSSVLALGFLLATAIPAVACSCMGPQPMAAYAGDPDQVVFAGVVMAPDGRGVPVEVTHWFQGTDAAPVVWLDGDGFGGDGGMCGASLPPAGTEWMFVAWRSEEGGLSVNLCTPHAAAADPEGQAMFQDAVATFGEGVVPGTDPSSPGEPDGGETGVPGAALAGGAAILLLVVGAAAIAVARGRRTEDGTR